MAGRGRGRGGKTTMSFTSEQLGKGESLPLVLQPPPKYPSLEYKPIPFAITTEMSYLMELKREYAEYMRESKNHVLPIVLKKDIERYSDRYQDLMTDKKGYEVRYDWTRMPCELKTTKKRTNRGKRSDGKKVRKEINIDKKLEELESKESTQQSDIEDEEKEEEDEDEDKNALMKMEDEEEEIDEEMDEGTDYVNSYFDNGEGYDDEDENLDDGPIY